MVGANVIGEGAGYGYLRSSLENPVTGRTRERASAFYQMRGNLRHGAFNVPRVIAAVETHSEHLGTTPLNF